MLRLSLLHHLNLHHFNRHLLHSTHTLLLPPQLGSLSAAESLMALTGQPCFYLIGHSPVNFAEHLQVLLLAIAAKYVGGLFIRLCCCYSNDFATIEEGHHW